MLNAASVVARALLGVAVILAGVIGTFLLSDQVPGPWNVLAFTAGAVATFAAAVCVIAWTGRFQERGVTR